ncbi:response regulator transcription factor [Streptomyces sp. CB01881]|uniref:response regulator n=1 Tax=Streptomyces sp. CB01881 TaxID=2078691 RepID=UPI000CDC06E2|nr:response regulator transcription factor [Streptomyces sp. CB01881]AUY48069.1 DNA-binding response regulator [Streptomyces sp. CB01881]TYC76553.1 DNA-binding response regulator [Streptomyces sp. CB01881]
MSAAEPVRVLVVDDQDLVREGIASLLGIQPGIEVVGTASDGRQAVEVAVAHRPDVALVDVRMPVMDGIETAETLAAQVPACRVVMLTTFDDQAYVAQALRAGAVGYLLKNLPSAELARAVHLVHAGVAQLDVTVMARLAGTLPAPVPAAPDPVPGPAVAPALPLTDRETEVLRLIAVGSTNREIAAHLHVSEGTVKNHISRILTRLNLRDRTQAALYAHTRGLL